MSRRVQLAALVLLLAGPPLALAGGLAGAFLVLRLRSSPAPVVVVVPGAASPEPEPQVAPRRDGRCLEGEMLATDPCAFDVLQKEWI